LAEAEVAEEPLRKMPKEFGVMLRVSSLHHLRAAAALDY
jgi:hypothetical protein